MQFSPAFPLLAKFDFGLKTAYKNEDDVLAVAEYLGVNLPDVSLKEQIAILAEELDSQNAYLSKHLISDEIYHTAEYRKSKFVLEIVANNRQIFVIVPRVSAEQRRAAHSLSRASPPD